MEDTILEKVWRATSPSDVHGILGLLGDEIAWVPLGDNPGNYGIVSMGSDPFDGITERITNSMDAMIELEVERETGLRDIGNPREAIERIHGFREGNLRWADQGDVGRLASDIKVAFVDSGTRGRPTVEIWDRGIGQHPSDYPDTLVSLNSDYKVSKLYLIGAFGQGGQTSFGHAEYGVIISRKAPEFLRAGQEDVIGWTIIRYRDPSTPDRIHKRGLWEYCVDAETRGVPVASPSAIPVAFSHGTLVRLVMYDLVRGTSDVLQPASTGWSYLSESLFDPVLPFRLYEKRSRFQEKNRGFSGLARRLWRGGRGEKVVVARQDSYDIDMGSHGSITLNYWALEPTKEPETKTSWRDIKKGYVSGSKAVFLTLNGQRHGVETTRYLRDRVKLQYSYDYVIVQADCDGLTNLAKKEIFSSTRDRLREGELKELVMQEVAEHLAKDRNLLSFERARKQAILRSRTKKDTSRIRSMVAKFIMNNPRLSDLVLEETAEKEKRKKQVREPSTPEDEIRESELELPDLKDVPTYIEITNASDPIPVEKGGNALIRLETDAVDSFLDEGGPGRLHVLHQSDVMRRKSQSQLRSGKISYHVHCPSNVRVGTRDLISFELLLPGGGLLQAEREVKCVKPRERKKEERRSRLPAPKIHAVSKTEDPELWSNLDFDEKSVGTVYLDGELDPAIYVSLDNTHFKRVRSKKGVREDIVEDINDRYVSAVAFHLLLMKVDEGKDPVAAEVEIWERRNEIEKDRLAQTVAMLAIPEGAL